MNTYLDLSFSVVPFENKISLLFHICKLTIQKVAKKLHSVFTLDDQLSLNRAISCFPRNKYYFFNSLLWKAALSVINHLHSFTFVGTWAVLSEENKKQLSDIFMGGNGPF